MRFTSEKKFKTWKEIKEGDTICYYDKGKIHKQTVISVEHKEEVHTYNYGWCKTESRTNYIVIKAGRGSEIHIYEHYNDCSFYEDYYFTRFTCEEAALECLRQHYEKLKGKSNRAKAKYEKFLNIANKYDNVIKTYENVLNV